MVYYHSLFSSSVAFFTIIHLHCQTFTIIHNFYNNIIVLMWFLWFSTIIYIHPLLINYSFLMILAIEISKTRTGAWNMPRQIPSVAIRNNQNCRWPRFVGVGRGSPPVAPLSRGRRGLEQEGHSPIRGTALLAPDHGPAQPDGFQRRSDFNSASVGFCLPRCCRSVVLLHCFFTLFVVLLFG